MSSFGVKTTSRQQGAAAEQIALEYLLAHGLSLLKRNYRPARRGGGEIDLIMLDPEGTVIFVEVRQRSHRSFGGAVASIDKHKQQRIVNTAREYLGRCNGVQPPCRFDVVALETSSRKNNALKTSFSEPIWLQAAFSTD